ncbi:MAG: hypothetical protein U0574_01535 [Phycisphaerales bacterium]
MQDAQAFTLMIDYMGRGLYGLFREDRDGRRVLKRSRSMLRLIDFIGRNFHAEQPVQLSHGAEMSLRIEGRIPMHVSLS